MKIIYLSVIFILIGIILFIRSLFLKKEIRNMILQLKKYNSRDNQQKVSVTLLDRDIEELAIEINDLIDLHNKSNIDRKSAERELKEAIANMSHDLRTPLTSILGYIQLMEDDRINKEDKVEYLAIVKDRTERLQTLLNDFFELSVIESIDYSLKPENLKINTIIEEILMNLYDRFNDRKIVPEIQIPKENIIIFADESAIKRVIDNLITNAIKYSEGNVSIELIPGGSIVSLVISNNVKELTEEDVQLFFDRFYTADQTRSGKGTGLGLSIAKSFMEMMDGKLSAELKDNQLYMKCEWKLP